MPSLHSKPTSLQFTRPQRHSCPSLWIHSCHWPFSQQDVPDSTNRTPSVPCDTTEPGSTAYKPLIVCSSPPEPVSPISGPLHTLLPNLEGTSSPSPQVYSFSFYTLCSNVTLRKLFPSASGPKPLYIPGLYHAQCRFQANLDYTLKLREVRGR